MKTGLAPLECSAFYCGAVATARCMISHLPFCPAHSSRHSPIGREIEHPFKSIPLRLLPRHTLCPECGRTVRIVGINGQRKVACRGHNCDWKEDLS